MAHETMKHPDGVQHRHGAQHPTTTTHDHSGHDRHEGHSVAMFRDRFWLSLALAIPALIWSPDIGAWFGYTAPAFPGSEYLPAVLGTVVFLYGGLVFLRGARGELVLRQPGRPVPATSGPPACWTGSWR